MDQAWTPFGLSWERTLRRTAKPRGFNFTAALRPPLHYLSYFPVLPLDSWLSFLLAWLIGLGLPPTASHTTTLS